MWGVTHKTQMTQVVAYLNSLSVVLNTPLPNSEWDLEGGSLLHPILAHSVSPLGSDTVQPDSSFRGEVRRVEIQ